jgi:tellurite resistance protein TerA
MIITFIGKIACTKFAGRVYLEENTKIRRKKLAVELKKGQKISLKKSGGNGEFVINLNWNQRGGEAKQGILAALFKPKAVDLDLGCLYELSDGAKGCVQALGNAFGNYDAPPYILLDKDDRTGAVSEGENLRINPNMFDKFKRILVYAFIYEGAANWQEVDGVVTVKYPEHEDFAVHLDEYGSQKTLCGIALFEKNPQTGEFDVKKLVEFFGDQADLDKAFKWGMRWSVGTKD